MSGDLRRLEATLKSAKARKRGIEAEIRRYRRDISRLKTQRRAAGNHYDAYLRLQDIDRQIKNLQRSIASSEREANRTRNEIRGLEAELRHRRHAM